jgi:hypothetical protein
MWQFQVHSMCGSRKTLFSKVQHNISAMGVSATQETINMEIVKSNGLKGVDGELSLTYKSYFSPLLESKVHDYT